jgi:hypothetical protein
MAIAAKIDFHSIPVIEVARALLGEESRERSTRNEKHFPDHAGLFVNVEKNRWYSHGNQVGGDAVALIRHVTECDFGAARRWLSTNGYIDGENFTPRRQFRRLVTTYDYCDADGTVYHVDRWLPKGFSQWREVDGERINGISGGVYERNPFNRQWYKVKDKPRAGNETREFPAVRPVPYRLPRLIQGVDPVLIPEGEKDVDNLRALGFTATCNHGGAGKWHAGLSQWFKGRRVVILVDNDPAGENHQSVVGAALRGVAQEIRVVRFADLGERADVSNLIERYGDQAKDEITKRCDAAPVSAPNGANGTKVKWADPDLSILTDQQLSPVPFPLNIFGPYWTQWIRDQAEAKSCAPDYVAGGLLGGASVLIGNARWGSPWAGWEEPPILWINNVGYPSSGKSPGLDAIRDVLGAIEADANTSHSGKLDEWNTKKQEAKFRLDAWESACKAAIKDKIGIMPPKPQDTEEPSRPTRKRIVTNDPTVEKVARLVLENPKGLMLFRDELAGWIGALDKYGGAGGDRAFYIEAYGGRSYAVDRIKDPEPIVVPALSIPIMGGIQPDRLATLVLSGDDDGLAARFIYLWPERIPPLKPENGVPVGAKERLATLYALQERKTQDGARLALPFDKRAVDALQEFRTQIAAAEGEVSGLYLSWLGKTPGMAVRLATVLEHLRWCGDDETKDLPEMVSEAAAVAAIVFLDEYAIPMARRCFGEAALPQVDRDAKVLARWIRTNEPDTINVRNLRRAGVLTAKDASRYDAAITELEAAGWVCPDPHREGSGSGRQRKDWSVNPRLFGKHTFSAVSAKRCQ